MAAPTMPGRMPISRRRRRGRSADHARADGISRRL